MAEHTKVDIETVDYECAMHDCGHEVSPCPSTGVIEACRECTERNWDENEGPVVTWDECQGVGAIWADELDDACLDEFDLPAGDHEIQEGRPCHLPQSAPPCVGCRCGADREEGGT